MKRNLIFGLMIPVLLASCSVYEDLDPCPRGVSLQFVYDSNMEYADAFSAQMHCLTLYVYDGDGYYVGTYTGSGDELKADGYRMVLDLPEGDYTFVAYGGVECSGRSFSIVTEPAEGSVLTDLEVQMSHENYVSDKSLHDLFWGTVDATVEGEMYKDVTLHLMKDTNNIRLVLQQAYSGSDPVDIDEFDIYITGNNYLLSSDNTPETSGQDITYMPWSSGDGLDVGESADGDDVSAAYAEFSVSRLMASADARLVIYSHQQQDEVVDIPLVKYLLLLKSEKYPDMSDQEYLDRESLWSMVFLLNDNTWQDISIIINDWTVRNNNVEL